MKITFLFQLSTKKRDKLKSINLSLFLKLDVSNVLSSQEVALQVLRIASKVRRTFAKRTSVL